MLTEADAHELDWPINNKYTILRFTESIYVAFLIAVICSTYVRITRSTTDNLRQHAAVRRSKRTHHCCHINTSWGHETYVDSQFVNESNRNRLLDGDRVDGLSEGEKLHWR